MPRQARATAPGVPHHVTHRGNNRQDVFLSDEDRRRYQTLLLEQLRPCGVELLGWCWMTNHVHLIAVPRRAESLARLVMRVHSRCAQDFNRRRRRSGHLWHSRFFSCILGPDHLQAALLNVDRNPVRAAVVGEAAAYPWSSAAAHVSGEDATGLLSWERLNEWGGCADWEARLRGGFDEETAQRLRQATQSGRPLGSEELTARLEEQAGRRLRPGRPGRPRKQKAAAKAVGKWFRMNVMRLDGAGEIGRCPRFSQLAQAAAIVQARRTQAEEEGGVNIPVPVYLQVVRDCFRRQALGGGNVVRERFYEVIDPLTGFRFGSGQRTTVTEHHVFIYGELGSTGGTWGDDADDWEVDGSFRDTLTIGDVAVLQYQTFTVAVGSGIQPWSEVPIAIRELDGSISGGLEIFMTGTMISINGDEATPESLGWCP